MIFAIQKTTFAI